MGKAIKGQLSEIIQTSGSSKYYDKVELTQQEIDAALSAAKQKKFHTEEIARKQQEYQDRINEIKRPFTAKELQRFILSRSNEFVDGDIQFSDKGKELFKALCHYFTNEQEFESMGDWKLNKGICLMGNVGTGKTTLMRMFGVNKTNCYNVISCRRVASEFAELGHDALYAYSNIKQAPIGSVQYFMQREIGYCFDDLGTENVKKNYGNEVNVMEEILLNRYDNNKVGWRFTHVTTNLTAEQIEQNYGARVRSRMREMFNIIQLTGQDLRK